MTNARNGGSLFGAWNLTWKEKSGGGKLKFGEANERPSEKYLELLSMLIKITYKIKF
jgi:hypothetical protein